MAPRKRGADQPWKEFKVVYFYSEDMRRQHMAFTHRNHETAGKLTRREADRLRFRQARQQVGIGLAQVPSGVQRRGEAKAVDVRIAPGCLAPDVEIAAGVLVGDRVQQAQGVAGQQRVMAQGASV